MTAKEVAHYLARTLKNEHSGLIQNYAVHHLEHTIHRALNAIANDPAEDVKEEGFGS